MKHWEKIMTLGGTYVWTKGDGFSSFLVGEMRPALICCLDRCELG